LNQGQVRKMSGKQNFVYQIRATRPGFGPEMTLEEVQAMSDHFVYLKKLFEEGKLLMAGPCLDFAFGLCILATENEAEARALMLADPSVVRGVMQPEFHAIRLSLWANR
jgi:uncharacterized protein YciI